MLEWRAQSVLRGCYAFLHPSSKSSFSDRGRTMRSSSLASFIASICVGALTCIWGVLPLRRGRTNSPMGPLALCAVAGLLVGMSLFVVLPDAVASLLDQVVAHDPHSPQGTANYVTKRFCFDPPCSAPVPLAPHHAPAPTSPPGQGWRAQHVQHPPTCNHPALLARARAGERSACSSPLRRLADGRLRWR